MAIAIDFKSGQPHLPSRIRPTRHSPLLLFAVSATDPKGLVMEQRFRGFVPALKMIERRSVSNNVNDENSLAVRRELRANYLLR